MPSSIEHRIAGAHFFECHLLAAAVLQGSDAAELLAELFLEPLPGDDGARHAAAVTHAVPAELARHDSAQQTAIVWFLTTRGPPDVET